MYRTGDLGRYRTDGNVEFLGRIDHQVKIRGFRIELGEIEAVLEQHPSVNQAVVIAREDTPGDKRLVGYFVPETANTVTAAELSQHVSVKLPEYMTPFAFVQMDRLPLTPNGKVDRKALRAPTIGDFESKTEYVAPHDVTERKLLQLWEQVLGIRPISVRSNFFDLGGRSILAARLFTRIARTFGKELPLSTLFRSPTVEQLANELRPLAKDAEYPTLVAIQEKGSQPPFFCVHGGAGSTLFLHQLSRELGTNQPFYGIEPEGLDGRRFQRLTVEAMATHYLAEIRKVQPSGPYKLGGYCFGGLVAFEMAQQLRRQGEQVGLIALFSAALRFNQLIPQASVPLERKPARTQLGALLPSPVKSLIGNCIRLYWRIFGVVRWSPNRIFPALGIRIPPGMRTMYVAQTLGRAERNYRPRPYSDLIVLFYGLGDDEYGPNLGWDGLAATIEHHVIGEDSIQGRRDIMNYPLVGATATELAPYLNTKSAAFVAPEPVKVN
jgi:thioesterase domain-containing protein